MNHIVSISGPVGTGKSTVLNLLADELSKTRSVKVIREYIDVMMDGTDKLNDYLCGDMSAYDFQDYILDYFDMSSWLLNRYDYILCERNPVEGVLFFARLDVDNNRMSTYQYETLLERASSMTFYPNPLTSNRICRIDTTNLTPVGVAKLISESIDDIDIAQLTADPKILLGRINGRNREGETDAYSLSYVEHMCQTYYSNSL